MLVVNLDSPSENWIVAGFNDNDEFIQKLVDDSNNELFEKLKKEPEDERELVKLIASKLGRIDVE